MIALDEDALICDFAETYHIYDYRGLPAANAATLAAGLRGNSRIRMKMQGIVNDPPVVWILALIADRVGKLFSNNLTSITDMMTGGSGKKEKQAMAFDSGEDYEAARKRLLEGV